MHTNRQRAPQGVGRAAAGLRPASDICARYRQKSKKRNKTLQQSQGDRFGWAKRNPQAPGLESAEGRYGLEYHTRSPFAIRKRQAGAGAENAYPYVGILQRVHSLSDYRARIPQEASRPAPALNQQSASFRTGGRFAARPCARFPEFPKGLFCILAPWHAVCKGRGANDRVARVKSAGAGQMSEIRCGAGRSSAKPRLR